MTALAAYQREIIACEVIELFKDENPGRNLNFSATETVLKYSFVEGIWSNGGAKA